MNKWKARIHKYRHAWILIFGVIYVLWFAVLEERITPMTGYHIMHTRLDDMIPFNEYFIVPYLLWFPFIFIGVSFYLLHNRRDFYRVCSFLFSGMILSLLFCTVYPNGTDFRPVLDPTKNIFTRMVSILYQTDTSTNVFPSIHVYNSIAMQISVMKSRDISRWRYGKPLKAFTMLLTISIIFATVSLKQHSVLDVLGSLILSSVIYGYIYGYPLLDRIDLRAATAPEKES